MPPLPPLIAPLFVSVPPATRSTPIAPPPLSVPPTPPLPAVMVPLLVNVPPDTQDHADTADASERAAIAARAAGDGAAVGQRSARREIHANAAGPPVPLVPLPVTPAPPVMAALLTSAPPDTRARAIPPLPPNRSSRCPPEMAPSIDDCAAGRQIDAAGRRSPTRDLDRGAGSDAEDACAGDDKGISGHKSVLDAQRRVRADNDDRVRVERICPGKYPVRVGVDHDRAEIGETRPQAVNRPVDAPDAKSSRLPLPRPGPILRQRRLARGRERSPHRRRRSRPSFRRSCRC